MPSGTLVGRIRAPLGLLTATALVAVYHYSVWRRERAVLPTDAGSLQETDSLQEAGRVQDTGPVRTARRTIGQVVLVTGSDPVPLSRAIHEASGADVTVWLRSGLPAGPDAGQPDARTLMTALEGVSAERVLAVVGPGARIDVIPVQATPPHE
ncbi:hypothetical protein [Arthrobacter ipis]|uniref:hypothetical protein n=1 Tax=Arthrobacter ipis TaxID=2716202 RepID=UPI001FE3ACA6|nr:hypothetical protein [Arthrobacter ipis]